MVFFGLNAEEYDRTYSDRELVSRIVRYFTKYRKEFKIFIVFMLLEAISIALQPSYMYFLISQIGANTNLTMLVIMGLIGLAIIHFVTWIFSMIRQEYAAIILNRVVYDLRTDVSSHVLQQDMSFFDKYSTGKIVSRIDMDTESFGDMVSIVFQVLASITSIVFLLIPMAVIDSHLIWILFIVIPCVFLFTNAFRRIARKKTLLGQRTLASVNSFVQESMTGIQIAKTFRQEEKLNKEFHEVNNQSYRVNFNRAMFMNIIFPGLFLIQALTYAFSIYYGGTLIVFNQVITTPQLYLFIQSLWGIFFPLFRIAAFWPQFQAGLAAAERTLALIDVKPTIIQNSDYVFEKIEGKIDFDDVCFSYTPDKPIFLKFNLSIKPGESVAIVGHTGAGKSSITRILMRFYEFQSGTISIDGKDIRDLSLKEYRKSIGLIPQTPFLWSDTLENNVKYGCPGATREEVLWALEQAGGVDWIEDLPNGIDTNIRERGKLLSMGQRQLIIFARTLLQNPSILILDEATASIDPFTETKIQEAMDTLLKGRTSIIVAHRLRTVQHVDRIIVLNNGAIVEEGDHATLMERGGTYADLYNKYFKHQSYEFLETTGHIAANEEEQAAPSDPLEQLLEDPD